MVIMNHLHPLMNLRTSRKEVNPEAGSFGWSFDDEWERLESRRRVESGLKPWYGVGESGAAHKDAERIISHIC